MRSQFKFSEHYFRKFSSPSHVLAPQRNTLNLFFNSIYSKIRLFLVITPSSSHLVTSSTVLTFYVCLVRNSCCWIVSFALKKMSFKFFSIPFDCIDIATFLRFVFFMCSRGAYLFCKSLASVRHSSLTPRFWEPKALTILIKFWLNVASTNILLKDTCDWIFAQKTCHIWWLNKQLLRWVNFDFSSFL